MRIEFASGRVSEAAVELKCLLLGRAKDEVKFHHPDKKFDMFDLDG